MYTHHKEAVMPVVLPAPLRALALLFLVVVATVLPAQAQQPGGVESRFADVNGTTLTGVNHSFHSRCLI